MLSGPVIVLVSLLYLGLLFAIAYYGDKRADAGRSIIATPSRLCAVDCRLLHVVDILRLRGARGVERRRTSCRSTWGRR